VGLLTSPAFQAQLKSYLPAADAFGPPFVADASPIITHSSIPSLYRAGKPVTVTGTVTNAEPGYPPLAGKTVAIDELAAGVPLPVAMGTTSSTGKYRIAFAPASNGAYVVSTGEISQIENASLSPPFGDLLSPASTSPVSVLVRSDITNLSVTSLGGKALVTGSIAPGSGHVRGLLTVLARPKGSKKRFNAVVADQLAASDGNFGAVVALAARRWQIEVTFADPNVVLATTSQTLNVTVGAPSSASVDLHSPKVSGGSLSLAGTVKPAAPSRGASVELLALNTTAGKPASLREVAIAKIAAGKSKFMLRTRLSRGARWVVALEYLRTGRPPALSKLRTIVVK